MSAGLGCEQIRDADSLAALEGEWWGLWRRCPSATPFQSPAWLLPWWSAFAPGELFVLAVRHGNRLIALAPLYLEIGLRGRRLLPLGASISDYQDILVDGEWTVAACAALSACLAEEQTSWEAWEIAELAPDALALALPAPHGCEASVEASSACPVLPLPEGTQALSDVVPYRKRRSVRMARNRAARRGAVEIAQADGCSASCMLETLIRLHHARWQGRGESGVMADPRVRQFHREAVPRLLNAGMLRLCELRIGGCPAAVYYGLQHGACAFGYLTGFDPVYEFESPGSILLAHAIECAIREGTREFHFLRGQEPYKYQWGGVDRWNRRRVFRRADSYARAS